MLRSDPSFKRLAPNDQQRLTQQLRQVDRMPEQQRERRLARNEMLERLPPAQRMSIARSGQQWATLPPERQTMMKRAFNDVYETMRKFHVYPRAAAYILAVGRVAEATTVRGLFP